MGLLSSWGAPLQVQQKSAIYVFDFSTVLFRKKEKKYIENKETKCFNTSFVLLSFKESCCTIMAVAYLKYFLIFMWNMDLSFVSVLEQLRF